MGLKHLKLKYRYLFKVIFREYFMAKETQENAFGKELLELLMEKKMWRQPIINRIGKKGADRLFSYYSTCRGIEKQVKNPGLNCNIERIEDTGDQDDKVVYVFSYTTNPDLHILSTLSEIEVYGDTMGDGEPDDLMKSTRYYYDSSKKMNIIF